MSDNTYTIVPKDLNLDNFCNWLLDNLNHRQVLFIFTFLYKSFEVKEDL